MAKQSKHNYRVSVYLGKKNYEELEALADFLGLSVATITRIMVCTGMQISTMLENATKGGVQDGR